MAGLLGFQRSDVDHALVAAATDIPRQRPPDAWRLQPGDIVVLTGAMALARWEWEEEARAAGLHVGDNVTKKTRLLVAADPDTMSGKAKKAHQYGIPIVHPTAYQSLLVGLTAAV